MPLDGAPTMVIEALLRERGLASAHGAIEAARATPDITVESVASLTRKVIEATGHTTDSDTFVAGLDRLLEAGAALSIGAILAELIRTPEQELSRTIERFELGLTMVPPEVQALVSEARALQKLMVRGMGELTVEVSPASVAEVLAARASAPLSYLTDLPVEIASLLFAQERALLAAMAATEWIEHVDSNATLPALLLAARVWREGARASVRLLASLQPNLFPESVVPYPELLDLGALVARRKEEDAWLAELVAAHPDDDRFAVYPDAAGHDAP